MLASHLRACWTDCRLLIAGLSKARPRGFATASYTGLCAIVLAAREVGPDLVVADLSELLLRRPLPKIRHWLEVLDVAVWDAALAGPDLG